ncbi:MAG: hypothetical protein L6R40_008212 [Gallowayella cf. fulva]|nr:MAG: hypothetical protein L6R40_008212 [Xanthomendoza cf. fulva]
MLPFLISICLFAVVPVLATDTASVNVESSKAAGAVYGSDSLSISATPTVPPGVTGASDVSSTPATATALGDPVDPKVYPECGQICGNTTIATNLAPGAGSGDQEVYCGTAFRSLAAGCEKAICNATDYTSMTPTLKGFHNQVTSSSRQRSKHSPSNTAVTSTKPTIR